MNKKKYCKMCGRRLTDNNLAKPSICYKLLSAFNSKWSDKESATVIIDICTPCATKTLYFLNGGDEK